MVDAIKVLVIEDEPELREILLYNFNREGFTAVGCGDGTESLNLLQQERPDVILLDLVLPGLDGWQVYARLRADHANSGIQVIIVSAYNADEEILRGMEFRADDYIRKTFRLKDLIARVQAVSRRDSSSRHS